MKSPAIRVRCPECGIQTLGIEDLGFTHDAGVVTGWYWRCRPCGQLRDAAADPAVLGLLHALGVQGLRSQPGTDSATEVDHRVIVSLRILLDDPLFLATLAEPAADERTPIRPTPPAS